MAITMVNGWMRGANRKKHHLTLTLSLIFVMCHRFSSELRATDSKSKARIQSEIQWLKFGQQIGVPTHVFRLGGIYGPYRR